MIFEFDEFLVDDVRRLITYRDCVVALTPRAFDVLVLLMLNHGRVVEKDEISFKLWNGSASDATIAQHIRFIRQALRDLRGTTVQTIPKRGFRFAASLRCQARETFLRRYARRERSDLRHTFLDAHTRFRSRSRAGVLNAIELFERILREDPCDAPALSALANAYLYAAFFQYRPVDEAIDRARATAANALRLEGDRVAATAVLAQASLMLGEDPAIAGSLLQQAVERCDYDDVVYDWYICYLLQYTPREQQLAGIEKALECNPTSPVHRCQLARYDLSSGEVLRARRIVESVCASDPNYLPAYFDLGVALGLDGDSKRARALFEELGRRAYPRGMLTHAESWLTSTP